MSDLPFDPTTIYKLTGDTLRNRTAGLKGVEADHFSVAYWALHEHLPTARDDEARAELIASFLENLDYDLSRALLELQLYANGLGDLPLGGAIVELVKKFADPRP